MISIILCILSLIVFSWCYSTIFICLMTLKTVKVSKASLILYLFIVITLYLLSYFLLSKYFNQILISSIIALILSFITPKRI